MISYVRWSKQPHWPFRLNPKPTDDDIMLGDYDEHGGGKWELTVRQHITWFGDAVIRVEIEQYDLQALSEPLAVRALLSLKGARTLDEAEARLIAAGVPPLPPGK